MEVGAGLREPIAKILTRLGRVGSLELRRAVEETSCADHVTRDLSSGVLKVCSKRSPFNTVYCNLAFKPS